MKRGNHSIRRIRLLVFLLLPLALFVGCAVLTVDVDVYKGDLANQKDVQLKQLAAMTMAAKPVLEELSDQLLGAIPYHTNFALTALSPHLSPFDRIKLVLNPRLASDVSGLFTNVDVVLSLYYDSPPARLREYFTQFKEASTRFIADSSVSNLADLHLKSAAFIDISTNLATKSGSISNIDSRLQNIIKLRDRTSGPASGKAVSATTNDVAVVEMVPAAMDEAVDELNKWGLQRGRADKGLDNIISDYLNYSMGLETNRLDDANNIYVRRMWIAAVDFGEKVKFIADNETDEERTISAFRFVHRDIQTLQAIGNSILSLADALNAHYHFGRPEAVTDQEFSAFLQASTNLSKAGGTNCVAVVADLDRTNFLEREGAIIDGLKNIQVLATLNGQTNIADRANAAIDLLTAYRSDRAFILPTMAYLRSSYPATSLQKNDDGLWRNMLAREGLHALPWPLGDWLSNGTKTEREDARTQADIDKQFWQNINQIRVAGSGITSYVITKDDIGNWYVKSYLSDPTPIIEGAKNLALDNIAPSALSPKQLGTLPQQVGGTNNPAVSDATSIGKNAAKKTKKQKTPATTTNAAATLEPGLLQTELNILQTNYNAATLDDCTNILETTNLLSNLSAQLGNVPAPSFTNTLTTSLLLISVNTNSISISSNFSAPVALTNSFTNSIPGQATNCFLASSFSNNVTSPGLGSVWTNNLSSSTNYGITAGTGSIIFTSSGTNSSAATPENVPLHFTNTLVTLTNSYAFPQIVAAVTGAPKTNDYTTNFTVQFTSFYVTTVTNTAPTPIVLTNIAGYTTNFSSTNLVPVAFYDTVTNSLTIVSIVTNIVQESVPVSYVCHIVYPADGTYTTVLNWNVTNTTTVVAAPDGTNLNLTTLTGTFNNTNGTPVLPFTSVSLGFLQLGYTQQVASALSNLASALTNTSNGTTNNVPAVATAEQKALQQWDLLINKTALSGISNQNQIVLKYVAPQIRSLASQRVTNLKTYEDGLNLLSQSQAQ